MLNFTLSLDEVNLILKGLGKLAAEESFATILSIKAKADEQLKAQGQREPVIQSETLPASE